MQNFTCIKEFFVSQWPCTLIIILVPNVVICMVKAFRIWGSSRIIIVSSEIRQRYRFISYNLFGYYILVKLHDFIKCS